MGERDGAVVKRIVALLELDRGVAATDVAERLGVTRQTFHNWAHRFDTGGGLRALGDRARRGRTPKLSAPMRRLLVWLLKQPPDAFGYAATGWTAALLRHVFATRLGVHVSTRTIRRAVHGMDHTWKRARYALLPDPDREKKRWIRRRIPRLPERSVILAEDETDLLLFPPLRSGWAPRGAQAKVWLTGRNASRVLLWLPKRSPHLNPMDHLWRDVKQNVCANVRTRASTYWSRASSATSRRFPRAPSCARPASSPADSGSGRRCQNTSADLLSRSTSEAGRIGLTS